MGDAPKASFAAPSVPKASFGARDHAPRAGVGLLLLAALVFARHVLERAYPRWHRIRDRPGAYVRTSLANAAASRWRRRSCRVNEVPFADSVPPFREGPEQRVVNKELVLGALRRLPPRMRAVLMLRYFDDLSDANIATVLGCGTGTVKSLASRGRARLRELLHDVELPNRINRAG